MKKKRSVICCSVLQKELETVLGEDYPDTERIFIDSMLHMHPEKLHRTMDAIMEERPESSFLIVFGDCHPYMHIMERALDCIRMEGVNCVELLLGKEAYTRYRNEKAFLFLPEWCLRWKEVFEKELGFSDPSLAREFMQETRSRLVYLDTGILPVPESTLGDIGDYFGMPVDIVAVSLAHLTRTIRSALTLIERTPHDDC